MIRIDLIYCNCCVLVRTKLSLYTPVTDDGPPEISAPYGGPLTVTSNSCTWVTHPTSRQKSQRKFPASSSINCVQWKCATCQQKNDLKLDCKNCCAGVGFTAFAKCL